MVGHAQLAPAQLALWGWVCLFASVLGIASAIFMIVVEPSVGSDRFSYPFTAGGFAAAQVWFFIQHFGLLAGVYALSRSGVGGTGWMARVGSWGALVGIALLTAAELVAISGANAPRPSDQVSMIESLYGIASTVIGVALIIAGIAVLRAGRWRGWRRYLPLVLGVYVFVPMTPALFASFLLARLAIGGWMFGFALLGWTLIRTARGAGTAGTRKLVPLTDSNLIGQTEGSR